MIKALGTRFLVRACFLTFRWSLFPHMGERKRLGVGGIKTQSVACREQDREGRAFPPLVVLMSVEEENGGRRFEREGSLTETHFRESSGQANGCSFIFSFSALLS